MPNVIPTRKDLMETLKKKRERAIKARAVQVAYWKQRGRAVMTLELAREIREFKATHPYLSQREIGEHFNVSHYTVARVLHHTLFPDR